MSPFPNIVSPLPEINSENGEIAGGEKIVARVGRKRKMMVLTRDGKQERRLCGCSYNLGSDLLTPLSPPVCTMTQQTEDGKTEIHLGKMEIFSDNLTSLTTQWHA